MNTNSHLTAAVAATIIDSRVREARNLRLVSEVRNADRTVPADNPTVHSSRSVRRWFSRPATA